MRIRKALPEDAAGIARVHLSSWRTTYPGIVSAAVLDNLSVERSQEYWSKAIIDSNSNIIVLVAEERQAGVVGFAAAGPERTGNFPYQGELYAIYMLKAYQGRGLGRQLVSAISQQLLDQNLTSMLVWVLKDNLFRAFYEALGGELVGEQDIKIEGDSLVEVAYGWSDVRPLVLDA